MASQKTVNLSQYYYRKSEIDAFINGGTLNGKHIYDHAHDYSKVTVTPKKDSGIEIAQIKVDDTTYSIKQQDTNTTYTPASTKPLTDSTTGNIGVSEKYAREDHAHPKYDYTSLQGTNNITGYINLIKITINNSYVDKPIVIKTQHRDKIERSVVQIKFSNANNADPSLQSITHTGQDMEFYLYKESPSNWILICGKGHGGKYDDVYIKIDNPNINSSISKLGTHLATLPTSNITQSTYTGLNIKENASNKSSSISEDTGSTSKYPTIKAVEDYTQNIYQTKLQQANKTDLNEATIEGWYNINCGTPNNIENIPTALNNVSFYGKLEVKNYNNYITQVLYVMEVTSSTHSSNPRIFYRNKPGSKESFDTDWREVSNINDIPTKTSDLTNDGDGTNVFVKDNDSRLTDTRTPKSHSHGYISNTGVISGAISTNVVTDENGKITTEPKITVKNNLESESTTDALSAKQGKELKSMIENITYTDNETATDHNHDDKYVQKNDSRLSDSRAPLFTEIPASSDLDTYRTGGFYYCEGDPNSKTIKNCPKSMIPNNENYWSDNKAFFLLVETWGTTSTYVKQTLTYHNNNATYIRTRSNNTWMDWKETADTNTYLSKTDASSTYLTTSINAGYVDDDFIMCFGDSRNLNIIASKECIQADETVTLVGFSDTATSLDFYKGNTKIGTSNVIDDCAAFTYTGNGSGMLNFSVKDGSSQSETCEITDAIFYDVGVGATANTKWDCNLVTRSVETNGTKFLVTSTSASARASMNLVDNANVYDFDAVPFVFEFDLVEYTATGACQAQVIQNTPSTINKVFSLKNSSYVNKTVKITYDGSKLKLYVDNTFISEQSVTYDSSNNLRIGFAFGQKDDYLIVKNVKLYPI